MAIFGSSKKSALERLRHSDWKDPAERDALISQVRPGGKPAEFVFLLAHTDPACRHLGAQLVQRHSGPGLIEALIEAADGKPELVRKAILRFTTNAPQEQMVRAIETMIGPASPRTRQRLGWQMAFGLPRDARAAFVERAIESDNEGLRAEAIQHFLADLNPGAAPTPRLLQLAQDPSERVRVQVIGLLEKSSDPAVVDLMIDRLLNDVPAVRQVASVYLSKVVADSSEVLRDRVLGMLCQGDDGARRAAIELLLLVHTPHDALVLVLGYTKDLLGWLRSRVLETLKGFGEVMLEPVATLLRDPDEEIRTQALILAQSIHDKRFVAPISKLLQDPDWWLRIMAADCLGAIGDDSAIPVLVGALKDPESQWAALDGLARIKSPKALGSISAMLSDPKPELRMEALSALGHFVEPKTLELLRTASTRDPSQEVRTRAAEASAAMASKLQLAVPGMKIETASRDTQDLAPINRFLAWARQEGASDAHISVDEPPCFRVGGEVKRATEFPVLDSDTARAWLMGILPPHRAKQLEERGEVDLCHVIPEVGRYRANIFEQRQGLCGAFRIIPNLPPTLAELGIPPQLAELLDYHQGLICVTGPSGSGKSTTLAALVNLINETKPQHVITLEDPIEFVHPVKSALINQREVGRQTESFGRGLRAALREDPDVIVVGEMRDSETMRMALTAAETGHLVLATLHTTSAVQTIDRLVDAFPPEEQAQVRMGLSESLKFVICQSLVPRADGNGRAAVFEILKGTLSVANLIRESKTYQLQSVMQIGKNLGMRTVDQALLELLDAGTITAETAHARAEKKEFIEERIGAKPAEVQA